MSLLFKVVGLLVVAVAAGDFLGGTISWMSMPGNSVRFTYRMSWDKGTGPCGAGCNLTQLGKLGTLAVPISALHWKYTNGTTNGTLGDVNYVVTSVSVRDRHGWEQGENIFNTTFPAGLDRITMYLSGMPWTPSGNTSTPAPGYMQTTVDLWRRSDTNRPNNSPYVALPPYIGVAFGCVRTIRLPVDDPDPDLDGVRCRWAKPVECRSGCSNVPSGTVVLNRVSCELTINPIGVLGYTANTTYRLAIVVEDTPRYSIKVGGVTVLRGQALSTIPLQITLVVLADSNSTCDTNTTWFLNSKYNTFGKFSTSGTAIANISKDIYLHTNDIKATEIMVSGPMHMNYTILPENHTLARTHVDWRGRLEDVGHHQFCFWGLRPEGTTTNPRCLTMTQTDGSNCTRCFNNSSCVNFFKHQNVTCSCWRHRQPPDCLTKTACKDIPCENNATCQDKGSGYRCTCPPGYTGTDCEQETSACHSSPCQHNGTCLNLHRSYRCLCPPSCTGRNCDEGPACKANPIENNTSTTTSPHTTENNTSTTTSPHTTAASENCSNPDTASTENSTYPPGNSSVENGPDKGALGAGSIAGIAVGAVCGVGALLAAGYMAVYRPYVTRQKAVDSKVPTNKSGNPEATSNDGRLDEESTQNTAQSDSAVFSNQTYAGHA